MAVGLTASKIGRD